jgi:hypothetical protein
VIKKNSNFSLNNKNDKRLSIQFNLDGFSFSIYDIASKKDVYFCEHEFETAKTTPENLLLKIENIFKTDTLLQEDFTSISVVHQNSLATLVPNQFFDKSKLASYLNFTIKTLGTDFITFDELEQLNSKNVYVPYVNINNYLFQNFGSFEYKHHHTVLIEKLLKRNKSDAKTMFVNVSKTSLDIVVLTKDKLLFCNTFSYVSKEDFIYYLLFVAEQLNLDVQEFPLYFMGKITAEAPIYKISYQYIKNIYFLESNNSIFDAFKIPSHTNFILLGS